MPTARPSLALLCLVPALAATGCAHKSRRPNVDVTNQRVTSIGVNAYLYKASLEVLNFLPLTKVDQASGVILSDWYSTPAAPTERIKVQVAILDQVLRADALQVTVIRQQQFANGWADVPVRAGTQQKLEEAILQRARDLRRLDIGE